MADFLPYGSQWLDEEDIQSVVDVLNGDWLTTGPTVDGFEEAIAEETDAEHAVAVNSGTAALHAAYEAVGVGPGTNVIVPSLTFSATANAARYLGAEVRFADVDKTLTMDPASAEALVDGDTRVIAPVDFAGHPARLDELSELADEAGAALVEDAAHSIGGRFEGRPLGSVADITCFSFHPVKTITSGEGGAAVTDSEEWAHRMKQFRSHGQDYDVDRFLDDDQPGGWIYDIHEPGFNYRITDMQCALGLSQLEKLDRFVDRRQEIAGCYRELFDDQTHVEMPPEKDWAHHAYHLFPIRVPAEHRKAIFAELRNRDIGVQVHYIPVNSLSYYRELGHDPENTPRALEEYRRLISIPCFPKMADEDIQRAADTVIDVVGQIAGENSRE